MPLAPIRYVHKIRDAILAQFRGMVKRAVLNSLTDGGMQLVNLSLRKDEEDDAAEMFEAYGFTSKPPKGSEGLYFQVGGDPAHGVVVCVGSRAVRLKGLVNGDVAMYDLLGNYVKLTTAGIVIEHTTKIEIGAGATQALVKGDAFKALYNAHTHAYLPGTLASAPTGPPNASMDAVPNTHTSAKAKTV